MPPDLEGYGPLSSRALWAKRALIAVVVLNVVGIISGFFAYQTYGADIVTQDDLDTTDLREGIVALLTVIAFLVAVVLFIRWFRRAYSNLPALGARDLRLAKWWTIGGWFIPIANLFIPKQIANDVWRASDPNERPDQESSWKGADVPDLFQWWWGFYLLSTWLENVSFRAELAANDLDGYKNAAAVSMVVNAVEAIAGVLAVLVVGRTTRRQEARAARLAQPESGSPAPLLGQPEGQGGGV
jgi:ABC-type Fe3+ transport system permease subunit